MAFDFGEDLPQTDESLQPETQTLYTYQCHERAGYLSGMGPIAASLLGFLSVYAAVLCVLALRAIGEQALKVANPKPLRAAPGTTNAANTTANLHTASSPNSNIENLMAIWEDPPPSYVPDSQTASASTDLPKYARWRAHTFTGSIALLGVLVLSFTTLGFALQNLFYCPEVDFSDYNITAWKVVVWLVYSGFVLFASSGLVACVIKFLALWGPATEVGKGKVWGRTILLDAIPFGLFVAVSFLPVMVGVRVGELILAGQRFCCPWVGSGYAEVASEDVELGDRGVQAEERREGTIGK